jgi:hypothetical protein
VLVLCTQVNTPGKLEKYAWHGGNRTYDLWKKIKAEKKSCLLDLLETCNLQQAW